MKKLFINLLAVGILFLTTSSVNIWWWQTSHVSTDVGVIPIVQLVGYELHQDTFYHNYVK